MSAGRLLLIVAACLLVGAVAGAMCVGLSDEPPRTRQRAPRQPLRGEPPMEAPAPEVERASETAPPGDEAYDEEEPEPLPDGVRSLAGRVKNMAGELVPGAEVEVEGYSGLRTVSDDVGAYQLHHVPLEAITLFAAALGYADTRLPIARGDPDAEERHDVALRDGVGVAGKVLDPNGDRVSGAKVRCTDGPEDELATDTNRYGRFALSDEAAGCDGVASYQGFADTAVVSLEVGARNVLRLRRPASIAGVVVGADDRAIRTFVVSIADYRAAGGAAGRAQPYRQTFSHPHGRFSIGGLAAGSYTLRITTRGGVETPVAPITLKEGQQLKDVRVVLP